MEDFLDRVRRIGVAADVAKLDHLGFEVHRVAVERRVRLVLVLRLGGLRSLSVGVMWPGEVAAMVIWVWAKTEEKDCRSLAWKPGVLALATLVAINDWRMFSHCVRCEAS